MDVRIIQLLMETKNRNHNNNHKSQLPPLHLAAKYFPESFELFSVLVQHGANPNEMDHRYQTVVQQLLKNLGKKQKKQDKLLSKLNTENIIFENKMKNLLRIHQMTVAARLQHKQANEKKLDLDNAKNEKEEGHDDAG